METRAPLIDIEKCAGTRRRLLHSHRYGGSTSSRSGNGTVFGCRGGAAATRWAGRRSAFAPLATADV